MKNSNNDLLRADAGPALPLHVAPEKQFPFAFSVGLIIFAGCMVASWGMIVSSATTFVAGVLVTFVGLALYARRLRLTH